MRAIVYRFFDVEGALLYVGMTVHGPSRWTMHAATQPWWDQVATVRVEHCRDEQHAVDVERQAIVSEGPRHNVIHNPLKRTEIPVKRIRMGLRPLTDRRPAGDGSVYRRQDGRWCASVRHEGHRYVRYTKDQAAAWRELARLRHEVKL